MAEVRTYSLSWGEAREWQIYKGRRRWKHESDPREEKQGYLHWHTQIQTLISNVLLPGGEKKRETKSVTQTETGGVVESWRKKQEDRQRETEITLLTDDSWKLKPFFLRTCFHFPSLLWFLYSWAAIVASGTPGAGVCVCMRTWLKVWAKPHRLAFLSVFHTHIHTRRQTQGYVQSPRKIFFCCDLFFSHTLSCLVGKVLENLKEFPLAWLAVAPVMLHYVVSLCSLPLQYSRKPVVVQHLQNHISWWKVHGSFMITTGGNQKKQ